MVKRDELLRALEDKNVDILYHANSVATAVTFLEAGAILSREYVEKHGLFQTEQTTDDKDKQLGIWNDIFFDAQDMHGKNNAKTHNYYGPVLFAFDMNRMLENDQLFDALYITKTNPKDWVKDLSVQGRYYQSIEEFKKNFRATDFNKHFTFRVDEGCLPFKGLLKWIGLDDPKDSLGDGVSFENARVKLEKAAKKGGVDIDIRKRTCKPDCGCLKSYGSTYHRNKNRELFLCR